MATKPGTFALTSSLNIPSFGFGKMETSILAVISSIPTSSATVKICSAELVQAFGSV